MSIHQRRAAGGFTLLELLVVAAIITVLVTLLFPAIRGTIGAARGFRCQSSQRTIAFDFTVFADDQLHGDRGDDTVAYGNRPVFRAETFQNSQYGLKQFWSYGDVPTVNIPDSQGRDPMRCPEVKGSLVLEHDRSCNSGGVTPAENVSFGMNIRLYWSEKRAQLGRNYDVVMSTRILDGYGKVAPADIPLLLDVDGAAAARIGRTPMFAGPSLDATALLTDNAYWFPGIRHNGAINVAFIDGHVKATRRPLLEPGWAWEFEPPHP